MKLNPHRLGFCLLLIAVILILIIGPTYRPAKATACTVTFSTILGGGTNDTFALYSTPSDYIVYTGLQQNELPYWWNGPGIPGYGITLAISGGCTHLRVASAVWHLVGDPGHYWEGFDGDPGHNTDGDINLTSYIPINSDIEAYYFLAGNTGHSNPYDYVTFSLYSTEGEAGPTPTATVAPSTSPTPTTIPTTVPYATYPAPTTGACGSTWDFTYNFNEGTHGWEPRLAYPGEGVQDSSGYHTVAYRDPGDTWSQHLVITKQIGQQGLPAATQIFEINLNVDYNLGAAGNPDRRSIAVKVDGITKLEAETTPPLNGAQTLSWTGGAIGGLFTIEIYASGGFESQSGANSGSATLNWIELKGNGYTPDGSCNPTGENTTGWAYPVASGDQSNWLNGLNSILELKTFEGVADNGSPLPEPFNYLHTGIGEGGYDHSKMALVVHSHNTQANVHAMFDGTVDSVVPLDDGTNICNANFNYGVYALNTPPPARTCWLSIAMGTGNNYALSYQGASLVTISDATNTATYLVSNAQVIAGVVVSRGCILGQTLLMYFLQQSLDISVPPALTGAWEPIPDGYTIVQARTSASDLPFDVLPELLLQPENLQCSTPTPIHGGTCAYVRDPNLQLLGDWVTASGTAPEHEPGTQYGLWLREDTYELINLDPTKNYTIAITTHYRTPGAYSFNLTLGANAPIEISVSSPSFETTNIPADTYLPTADEGFKLLLSPTQDTQENVIVDFVCVEDEDSGPTQPAGGCLLINPEFDSTSGWALSDGGHGVPNISVGRLWMPDGSTAGQYLHLFPKDGGPQEYKITVSAMFGGVPSGGDTISLDWDWGIIGSGTLGPFTTPTEVSDSDTFSVSSEGGDTLVLTASASSTTFILLVTRVCITTNDGADPPGYQPAPQITPYCKVCEYTPVGDLTYDVPMLIGWLMCGVSQLWYCQAKIILMGIWQVLTTLLTFIALLRQWASLTLIEVIKWGNNSIQIFAAWLNAEIANLQTALTGAVASWSGQGSGTNFWDALVALFNGLRDVILRFLDDLMSLLMALIGLIGTIITLIYNMILYIINQLVALIKTFLDALFAAINAPPVTPTGIPVCDTNAEIIYENCLPIFIIDNTILADNTPLGFLLPFIEGTTGFALLWWGINRIRDSLVEH